MLNGGGGAGAFRLGGESIGVSKPTAAGVAAVEAAASDAWAVPARRAARPLGLGGRRRRQGIEPTEPPGAAVAGRRCDFSEDRLSVWDWHRPADGTALYKTPMGVMWHGKWEAI